MWKNLTTLLALSDNLNMNLIFNPESFIKYGDPKVVHIFLFVIVQDKENKKLKNILDSLHKL